MKKYNIRKIMQTVFLPCFLLYACTACVLEKEIIDDSSSNLPSTGNETQVNFSIVVPSPSPYSSPTQTRSTKSVPDEGAVDMVHLLLFEEINGVRTYRYRIQADNINAISNTQKTFHVNLPTGIYDIVVLANAQEILNNSGAAFGDTKESVLDALVETNPGKDNIFIPMWGQQDNRHIDNRTDFTGNNAVKMIRMVAKIEVEVMPDAAGTNNENFKLTDIRLYNYSAQGALVPDRNTWPPDNKAVLPSEPAMPGGYATARYPENTPLIFNRTLFYAYETPAGGKGQAMPFNTCLVIGGSYRGRATSYYRVDFTDKNQPDIFLPLLRNHHYLVKVIDVTGDGYPTPEIAFDATRSDMETTVTGWNDSGMSDVVVDRQNSLEVSKNEFIFTNSAQTTQTDDNRLTIRTSVTGGWEIEKITDDSSMPGTAAWLTVSESAFSSPDTPKDIYLFTKENTTGSERTAYLYIRAGQLSFRVTVVQKELTCIRITDDNGQEITELAFPLTGGTKRFNVEWTPVANSVTVSVVTAGQGASGSVAFSGSGFPGNKEVINGGAATYNVTATAYTSSDLVIHRASKLDFTIISGSTVVTRTLFLRQFDFNLIPIVSSYFLMDGSEKKFGVRANTTWEIIDVIDQNDIITNRSELIGKTGGLNITSAGEDVSFRIVNRQSSPSAAMPAATIVFRNALGTTYNAKITGLSTYVVNNLLVWPVDIPITSTTTWYNLADVPEGTNSILIPPAGLRNTTVDPRSCAALDPSNKDLWRLPTVEEIHSIFSYFRSNGGYDKYGMANVDYIGSKSSLISITNGYWTAESSSSTMAYYAAYSTSEGVGGRGAILKSNAGPTFVSEKTWNIYTRCVRNK
ncbi:MAG: FimB/Mfa2 family fimbrial subunit [Tannerella sp.]|jgi:hypothetical protein|nr:FimB/Mfa2 family fimbrial subunit [Tannerella sp.]